MKLRLLFLMLAASLLSINLFAQEVENGPLTELTPQLTLIQEGWKLESTSIENGITKETYVKEIDDEDVYINTLKKDNGEFKTLNERESLVGDYKWTNNDGIMEMRQGNHKQQKYPNGMVVDYPADNEQYLYLPNDYSKGYRYIKRGFGCEVWQWEESRRTIYVEGYLVGDKVFQIKQVGKDFELVSYCEKYGTNKSLRFVDFYFTRTSDKIKSVSTEDVDGKHIKEILYESGDRYKAVSGMGDNSYEVGTLHGKDYVIDIKKGKWPVLTKNDGTKIIIKGAYKEKFLEWNSPSYAILYQSDDITNHIYYGLIIYPDGREETIIEGLTPAERDSIELEGKKIWLAKNAKADSINSARIKAELDQKEKEEAEKAAAKAKERQNYMNKWGFYPGDFKNTAADMRNCIKPGRPFGAIKEYYGNSIVLDSESENTQWYWMRMVTYKVYFGVRDGKVTYVSWY